MKKLSLLAVSAIVATGMALTSCDSKNSSGSVKLKTETDSVSYIIGLSHGSGNRKQIEQQSESWPAQVNLDALFAGFVKGLQNADDTLFLGKNMQEANEYLNAYFSQAQTKAMEEAKVEADKFFAENGAKNDVFTTTSGLQYKVMTEGKGPRPKEDDVVKVHYHGSLLNGEVFESSVQRGEPADIPVGNVIQGFKEALLLMPVGSKYTVWIPIELGYYQAQSPLANKVLIFELELLEIIKKP